MHLRFTLSSEEQPMARAMVWAIPKDRKRTSIELILESRDLAISSPVELYVQSTFVVLPLR
jgi:hypothetical protein